MSAADVKATQAYMLRPFTENDMKTPDNLRLALAAREELHRQFPAAYQPTFASIREELEQKSFGLHPAITRVILNHYETHNDVLQMTWATYNEAITTTYSGQLAAHREAITEYYAHGSAAAVNTKPSGDTPSASAVLPGTTKKEDSCHYWLAGAAGPTGTHCPNPKCQFPHPPGLFGKYRSLQRILRQSHAFSRLPRDVQNSALADLPNAATRTDRDTSAGSTPGRVRGGGRNNGTSDNNGGRNNTHRKAAVSTGKDGWVVHDGTVAAAPSDDEN